MMAIQISHKQQRGTNILNLHGSHWNEVEGEYNQDYDSLQVMQLEDWTHKGSVWDCLTPHTLKTSISQQPHSNLGWRNAP